MKRIAPPLQFLAAAAVVTTDTAAAMASRSTSQYGGPARKQLGRGFSDRPYNGDRQNQQSSVRDTNMGFRRGGNNRGGFNPRPSHYNQNRQFRYPPPFNQNQNYNRQFRPSDQNQGFRPRNTKPLDYREWQYAKLPPPPNSDRFIVLSYNILAEYLAINHRSKLYYHIPRHMLEWEWRKRNLLFELRLWSADIMCFQEVDRFQELEEELKLRGYSGIWKMRTGNAIDGCAVFWRTTRFKLLYEESIEFNKLGLRDNVAQICVLELTNQNYDANTSNESALSRSSTGSNKVVICNIHVLYNPKRGEIKLGQVRMFLDRAHAVSKTWNVAPVVLCGDFNSTPKSPLYNFISEKKLDLSGVDRDKVSGQASAEILAPRPYNPSHQARSSDNTIQVPSVLDNKLGDSLSYMQKQNNSDKSGENISSVNNYSQPAYTKTLSDTSVMSHTEQHGNVGNELYLDETKVSQRNVVECCNSGIGSSMSKSVSSNECSNRFHSEGEFNAAHGNDEIQKSTPSTSGFEDSFSDLNKAQQNEKEHSASFFGEGLLSEDSQSNVDVEDKSKNVDNCSIPVEVSLSDKWSYVSSQPVVNDEYGGLSTSCEIISNASMGIYNIENKNPENYVSSELNYFLREDGIIGDDQNTFLSELHDMKNTPTPHFGQMETPILDQPFSEYAASAPSGSRLHSPNDDVLNDFSLSLYSEADVEKNVYDPSLWTPMEIATATGNADCTILEHPLQLKSSYVEVEDNSGTRDANGEPLVTSYNRCFLGTVDYIWCSEDLQTVRVLAPLPKHAMQWTDGFPTRKWGSDHIALASEVAFTKGASDSNIEVQ